MAVALYENKTHAFRGGVEDFLSEEHMQKLKSIMYPGEGKAGSYLFWEGDEADKLYYVRSGRVMLKKSTEEGKELILSVIQSGGLIGEYGGSGEPLYHGYQAKVTEEADIGVIQIKDLEILMHQFGGLAVEIMNWLGWMHRKNESKFRDLLLFGKSGALASTLIRMSNTYGTPSPEGIRLDVKLTHAEIADLIGTTRESVNRTLNAWKEEGIIEWAKGRIVIRKLENLRSVCQCPSFPACPESICRL